VVSDMAAAPVGGVPADSPAICSTRSRRRGVRQRLSALHPEIVDARGDVGDGERASPCEKTRQDGPVVSAAELYSAGIFWRRSVGDAEPVIVALALGRPPHVAR